ncbi:DUF4147 domain-containing protein [Leptospira gomenensis]|uniref:DUF4147 domain-containing protein n=1 Tax=Leptospira gomenensis TaxID=2484974 RepID=A0A5F1YIL2_9LEPT|nr:DUF4147 domain-containing protein [Leptospira gomenensis]TGK37503.1 DUF4147 domain-containing protein [Leptospira gomenensis]TGK39529.1 DUF4147 domain-containing protein [Leptospira gomenensis]TGK43198.1 DUF4147 domain-containing protein [Leptospira gomenensis]TGK55109.1 DUF4147 domain-containing protein [Leptospira gomenensis]
MPRLEPRNVPQPDLDSPESVLYYAASVALCASSPGELVRKFLREHDLIGNIRLLSIGKAAYSMAISASEILGERIERALIVTKYGHCGPLPRGWENVEAGHPIPDERSLLAGKRTEEFCSDLKSEDLVLVLLSGGGSSLLEIPEDGLELEDLVRWNRTLLECGADISEINSVRILLSKIKGGGLLEKILPANSVTLVLSDVLGDDLSKVASGPMTPAKPDRDSIYRIFKKYNLIADPKIESLISIRGRSESGADPKAEKNSSENTDQGSERIFSETEAAPISERNTIHCIGNLSLALDAVVKDWKSKNLTVSVLTSSLNCEAKEAGSFLGSIALEYSRNAKKPSLFLCGGETIVTHDGKGKGGRNQELALAFAKRIRGETGIFLLSLATDGTDGPTDAAGAYVDGETWDKIGSSADPEELLRKHESYSALEISDSLLFTGPTGTNVNDIQFLWITPGEG